MADFSQIKRQGVIMPTARHTFYEIEGEPWVEVKPATERNKPFFNSLLKRQRRGRRIVRGGALTVDVIKRARDDDRDLYAKYIVTGWGNVVDVEGTAVDLSPDNCLDFLHAIQTRALTCCATSPATLKRSSKMPSSTLRRRQKTSTAATLGAALRT